MGWLGITGGIVAFVLLMEVVSRFLAGRVILRFFELKLPLRGADFDPVVHADPIEFLSSNGMTLRGGLFGAPPGNSNGLIIFCPEMNGGFESAGFYCRGLIEAGYTVLGFDFRSQGQSDAMPGYNPLHWVTDYEVADVNAAIQYVLSHPQLRELPIGLVGMSRGGGAALAAAAVNPHVQAVAVEGVFTTAGMHLYYTLNWATMFVPGWVLRLIPQWHIKGTLAMCRWWSGRRRNCHYTKIERLLPQLNRRPVLLMAGRQDSYVPLEIARAIRDRIKGDHCELWAVPGAKHNGARHANPTRYDAKLVEFFYPLQTPGDKLLDSTDEFAARHSTARGREHQPAAG